MIQATNDKVLSANANANAIFPEYCKVCVCVCVYALVCLYYNSAASHTVIIPAS